MALQDLLADYPSHQATEDALFEKIRADIERSSQANEEALFSRGLGLSTIQGEIERARGEALAQGRRDAFLAAQQAQLAAAAQAAQQQQFRYSLAQRQAEAGSADRARKAAIAQKDRGQLFQAGGALGGAAMNLLGKSFAPEIGGGLRSLFGLEQPLGPGQTRMYGQLGAEPSASPAPPAIESPGIEAPVAPFSDMPAPDLSGAFDGTPYMGSDYDVYAGQVDMPSFDFSGLESLYWDNPQMQNWGDYL